LIVFYRIACAALTAALLLSPSSRVHGEDEKPIVSIKTRYVQIHVTIERALRAYQPLYSALVTEARAYAADEQKEAQEAWRTDRALFGNQPWTFDRIYRLRAAALPYVSVLVDDGRFTGGAHPNTILSTVLWDTRANRRVEADELFRETENDGPTVTALAKLVREAILAEKKRREAFVEDDPATDQWLQPIKADFSTLGTPSLAPSTVAVRAAGMTFHFSPYGVGPYAEGSYTAFVPFSALAPYLTEAAKAIFAGERPQSDADE
jgi:Protein of unknown function (DUF3298)